MNYVVDVDVVVLDSVIEQVLDIDDSCVVAQQQRSRRLDALVQLGMEHTSRGVLGDRLEHGLDKALVSQRSKEPS